MQTLVHDIRYGIRMLFSKPAFTALSIITLGLGIGANTAIFSLVNAVLLKPFAYPDSDRIVTLWQNNQKSGVTYNDVAPANFLDWKEQASSFESMAGVEPHGFSLIGHGEPERFAVWLVTESFFETMGVEAYRGRTFTPTEYQPGNDRVVILSHGLWKRRFGADENLIGQKLTLNGQPYMVTGVMPPEFQFPPDREMWAPRVIRESDRQLRAATYWNVVGRLRDGVSLEQAGEEMKAIALRLEEQYPEQNGGMGVTTLTLPDLVTGESRRPLLTLLGAVMFVLLIACANVANLLIVRGTERRREFAIRSALGGQRRRLIRQLLTESLLLALPGGALGLMLASWGISLIAAFNTSTIPRIEQVDIDSSVLLFALGISIITAVVFGLIPATQISKVDLQSTLKTGPRGHTMTGTRSWLRNSLVAGEVALALLLLIGAGLLVRSFYSLMKVDPGFSSENVVALQVFRPRNLQNPEQLVNFVERSLDSVESVPGVSSAAIISTPPFIRFEQDAPFIISGQSPPPRGSEPTAFYAEVSSNYIDVMSIPLISGRFLNDYDNGRASDVVVINRTMAERYFPNENPVGKKLLVMFGDAVECEIVGIIGDILHQGLDATPRPQIFVHHQQSPTPQITFLVKTSVEAGTMVGSLKEAIRKVNPSQTFARTATMEELVSDTLNRPKFNLFLLGSFALLALILAGIGIYGVISSLTRQRTHEIGVRMALGANSREIRRMVLRQALLLTVSGIVAGLVASAILTQLMRTLIFGVSTFDPITFAAVSILLILVGVAAAYVPARRATRIDPIKALRYE